MTGELDWDRVAAWWEAEIVADPSYREDVLPMLRRLVGDAAGTIVDLGCGEGQGIRTLAGAGRRLVGCDLSAVLLRSAAAAAPVVRCRLPALSWLRDGSIDHAYSVYVLDLLPDAGGFFAETARVVRPGGAMAVIINHPAFTAPDAGPFLDEEGDVMWRWGRYFDTGRSLTLAGLEPITIHHRPMGLLLSMAAQAGWNLDTMEERGLSATAIEREPGYRGQDHIPRFLGVRWVRG